MNLKLSLATATALGLLMGSALADSNFANVEQSGADNDGSVVQGPGDGNALGTIDSLAPGAALQSGNNNDMTVLQSGSLNEIGTEGDGFDQTGRRNFATVTQTSDENLVGEIQQSAVTNNGNGNPRNTLTITQQGGNGNTIDSVQQTRVNSGNAQAGNVATITQGTSGNSASGGNGVGLLSQDGRGNNATVIQSSGANQLGTLLQEGRNNIATLTQQTGDGNSAGTIEQDGNGNSAGLTFSGAGNGTVDFTGLVSAQFPGLIQGSAYQYGSGNILSFTASGDANSFGFSQDGDGNMISGTVVEDSNQVGVLQDGDDNIANVGITGSQNQVAIGQTPGVIIVFGIPLPNGAADNLATVNIIGDLNMVGVSQLGRNNNADAGIDGDDNDVDVRQDSNLIGNTAAATIVGDDNDLLIDQDGANNASATVTGNTNLLDIVQAGLSSATAGVTGDDNVVSIDQDGINQATVTIAGLAPAAGGNGNTVAATQLTTGLGFNDLTVTVFGSDNDIVSSQTNGGFGTNSAAITFNGNNNFLDVVQTKGGLLGSGNSLTVNLTGNDNNDLPGFTSPVALSAAGTLSPGQIVQSGAGNGITLNVGANDPASNGNLFAFSQTGDTNTIQGAIDGSFNQAVVVQAGSSNFTSFVQIGNYNVLGVNQ